MRYEISYSCFSHIGNIRSENQDNFICDGLYRRQTDSGENFSLSGAVVSNAVKLFGVFDGMGGEECGEIASYIAAKEASAFTINKDAVSTFSKFCKYANEKICEYAENNGISAMGTTAAMLLFSKREITLCNIGDSKVFRLSNSDLEQISKDHIVVSAFGTKPPLSQNLGIPPDQLLIEPYLSQGKYRNGDKYLVCSDGLTDMLSLEEIKNVVLDGYSVEERAERLVNRALKNGGKDNITVILLEIRRKQSKLHKIIKNNMEEK